jgi:hypothetical protein
MGSVSCFILRCTQGASAIPIPTSL